MDDARMYDVIVVGAGMAGLTAARALGEGGLRVCVAEAQERVGGRILTRRVGEEAVELGAEFVHGRPPELWALIDEMGLETYERDGAQVGVEDGRLEDSSGEMDAVFEPLEELEDWVRPGAGPAEVQDCSFAEFLDRKGVSEDERRQIVGYVEGFNAADHRVISAASLGAQQRAEDATEGDRVFQVKAGYDRLSEYLAERVKELGGEIRLGVRVESIRWSAGAVEVVSAAGVLRAGRVVVTVPLALLQSGAVRFEPAVETVTAAAPQMRMGQVCRFTMLFRRRFWEEMEPQPAMRRLSFLYTFGEIPPVWWTPHPERSNSLTGWAGGPRADELLRLSPEELEGVAVGTLAKVLRLAPEVVRSELTGFYTYDWQADEFAGGAYSYVASGGMGAPAAMAEPVERTVFFAGEHTDVTGHWGTVHAAMRSGLRVAGQILA